MNSETLWDFLLEYLDHNRRCPKCNEIMWVGYCDGHVADECLDCPREFSLDLAGYITNYPVPKEPLPDSIEARVDEWSHLRLPHERYYRLKTKAKAS
jgi:hypothetical protein